MSSVSSAPVAKGFDAPPTKVVVMPDVEQSTSDSKPDSNGTPDHMDHAAPSAGDGLSSTESPPPSAVVAAAQEDGMSPLSSLKGGASLFGHSAPSPPPAAVQPHTSHEDVVPAAADASSYDVDGAPKQQTPEEEKPADVAMDMEHHIEDAQNVVAVQPMTNGTEKSDKAAVEEEQKSAIADSETSNAEECDAMEEESMDDADAPTSIQPQVSQQSDAAADGKQDAVSALTSTATDSVEDGEDEARVDESINKASSADDSAADSGGQDGPVDDEHASVEAGVAKEDATEVVAAEDDTEMQETEQPKQGELNEVAEQTDVVPSGEVSDDGEQGDADEQEPGTQGLLTAATGSARKPRKLSRRQSAKLAASKRKVNAAASAASAVDGDDDEKPEEEEEENEVEDVTPTPPAKTRRTSNRRSAAADQPQPTLETADEPTAVEAEDAEEDKEDMDKEHADNEDNEDVDATEEQQISPVRAKRGRKKSGPSPTSKTETPKKNTPASEKRVLRDRRSIGAPEHFVAVSASKTRTPKAITVGEEKTAVPAAADEAPLDADEAVGDDQTPVAAVKPRRGRPSKTPGTTPDTARARRTKAATATARDQSPSAGTDDNAIGAAAAGVVTKSPAGRRPATTTPRSGGGDAKRTPLRQQRGGVTAAQSERQVPAGKRGGRTTTPSGRLPRKQQRRPASVAGGDKLTAAGGPAKDDPFSLDDANLDVHPEPLRHISVNRFGFGVDLTFKSAVAPKTGGSRYATLENAASARRYGLSATVGTTATVCGTEGGAPAKPTTPASGYRTHVTSSTTPGSAAKSRTPKNDESVSADLFSDVADRDRFDDDGDDEDEPMQIDEQADLDQPPAHKTPVSGRKRGRRPKSAVELTTSPTTSSPNYQQPSAKKRRRTGGEDGVMPLRVEAEVTVPELGEEEQLAVDHPSTAHDDKTHIAGIGSLLPGARVLAKWKDHSFYPGRVASKDGLGRYKVRYADGKHRDMPPPDAVPLGLLQPGKLIMFCSDPDEGLLEPVEILQMPSADDSREWFEGVFRVRNTVTGDEQRIHWEKFVIDKEQTKDFVRNLKNAAFQQISQDNVSGSRVRERRPASKLLTPVAAAASHEATPPTSADAVTPKQRQKRMTPAATSTPRARGRPPKKTPVAAATTQLRTPLTATVTPAESADANAPAAALVAVVSPLVVRAKFFEGMTFVLTSANRRIKPPGGESGSDEERPPVPFIKREVRQMIEQHGGKVVDDFSTITNWNEKVFLVADTHYRTHKYLSALCRAVPCVSHVWIHNCCSYGVASSGVKQLLEYKNYMLPAGQSIESANMIEWHAEGPHLLAGTSVLVHTENRPTMHGALDFVQIWKPLVECMGATVLNDFPAPDSGVPLDVLLTDASCQPETLARAAQIGAAPVSSEWLIQAIITGRPPAADAHPRYRYDFVENAATAVPPPAAPAHE